ncbi:SulP family inorganic anion transporter [Maridesulfovibrio hydrothermalis]|uniref:Putative sulfate transporter yvdB n=1 Tax=Maridesulfovibrio hydrothermalis AM13 = DSM 14728 TaxID=1121451 RepID=L0RCX9_9BACT|nr:SulP family inorganic anion transporter [Maridesulfovibrio hydrothermalis]CCO24050.1 putative sulfate transporter yvdB [Maridesulfovibrio hydrothermalis AM13 = DSM 14728]
MVFKMIFFQSLYPNYLPAIVRVLRRGYTPLLFARDLWSGITVGIVALPLAMAFAIAAGASPEQGIFTALVAGFIISGLGGSRFQIGGPTGAFVVIVGSIIVRHGYDGLVVAMLLAGLLLFIMGLFNFGQFLKFIPYPVITGFTTGIALLIVATQIKDFLGLNLAHEPSAFLDRLEACFNALPTASSTALTLSVGTLSVMLLIRHFAPKVPAHIVGICFATAIVWTMGLPVETIGSHFGGIPAELPHFHMPVLNIALIRAEFPDALTIALLAGIESLLSAVVADGMTGSRHNSTVELMAQGLANIASGLFGGIPATGAIARTATNIRAGAYSPVSGLIHVATLATFLMICSGLLYHIPLASLAAVLIVVAWDMSELHRFKRLLHAPKMDSAVLLLTFGLTVFVDLTVAVQVGVVLSALLFMKRMSEVSGVCELSTNIEGLAPKEKRTENIMVYEINGPFFFGMAQRFIDTMQFTRNTPKVLIIRLAHVYHIDATAIEALEGVVQKAHQSGILVILAELSPGIRKILRSMGTKSLVGQDNILPDFQAAMVRAKEAVKK